MADARRQYPEVPAECCFVGLDAFKKALAVPGVNYAILASPPGFRPMHLEAAIGAGKHVFMEKPVAVDGPGIRAVLKCGEVANQKGLKIAAGTQRRHRPSYIETVKRIQDGAIGELSFLRAYWNTGAIWHRGEQGATEMEIQVRNWYHYVWLCGDHICEQHVHNLDVCNWVMGAHPVRCLGLGGRQGLGNKSGHIFDHFAVEYEYANGVRMYSQCRQINNCAGGVYEVAHGTQGVAEMYDGRNSIKPKGGQAWRASVPGDQDNGYVNEHRNLVNAIRNGTALNEAKNVAESTLTAIMGRESCYSGQQLEWEQMLNAKTVLGPEKLEWGPAPKCEVAKPGIYKVV
jgi:predicted dehydrogenase